MTSEFTTMTTINFELADLQGRTIRLADYRGRKHVVLVFNRGLM